MRGNSSAGNMLGVHVNVRKFMQSFMDAIRLAINLGWIADFAFGTIRISGEFSEA